MLALGFFCGSSSFGILGFPSHLLMLCQADLMSMDPVSSQSIAETARRGASLWSSTGTTDIKDSLVPREIFPRQDDMTRCFKGSRR